MASTKGCFNRQCSESGLHYRPGWRLSSGERVDLCDRCASAFEQGMFCDTFHLSDSGWRTCESCEKPVHCGCIVSATTFVLVATGGINCLACSELQLSTDFHVPPDLMDVVMLHLPIDSLARLMGTTRYWSTTARSTAFQTEFLTSSRGRLLRNPACFLVLKRNGVSSLFTCAPAAVFHLSTPAALSPPLIHGLFCLGPSRLAPASQLEIYNPTCRARFLLPTISSVRRGTTRFIAYDPDANLYKILLIMKKRNQTAEEAWVYTVGGDNGWKQIANIPYHRPQGEGVCIEKDLFYVAGTDEEEGVLLLAKFSVEKESIEIIKGPAAKHGFLTTYKGNLSMMESNGGTDVFVWMLEKDLGWVKESFSIPVFDLHLHSVTNNTGELIFAPEKLISLPLEIVYYNLEKGTQRKIEISGEQMQLRSECAVYPSQAESLVFL